MTWFARSSSRREREALLDYWDDVIHQRPAIPVPPTAVPGELGALVRTIHTAGATNPDHPAYEDRLLQSLLARQKASAPMNATAAIAPPLSPSAQPVRQHEPHRRAQPFGRFAPALGIGLVILLAFATLAGIWWTTNRQDEPRVSMMAPEIATPSPEASAGWSHFKGDAARRGETNAGPVSQPVELWRYQADDSCNPSPSAVGAVIYVACADGMLTAFDADTGEIRWQFSAEPLVNGPSVADGVAYVIGGSGTIYAVDTATGTERWRFDALRVQNSPAVADGLLVTAADGGTLAGIDAATGAERWRIQVTDAGSAGTPALLNGMAYVGSESGTFTAVDVETGEIVWQVDTGDLPTGTAVVADGIAYIGAPDSNRGSLSAYDAVSGELLWRRDEPIYTPAVANGIGYATTADGIVSAFDTATGEERWRSEVGGTVRPVIIAGDVLYVPSDGDRTIYAFDAQSGAELWSIPVDGGMWNGPAVADGRIVVATTFGVVQVFGEGDSDAVAASPEATPMERQVAAPSDNDSATPAAGMASSVEFVWQSTGNPDSPLLVPTGMAVAPDGTIWVVDSGNNRFQLFSPEGEYLETWGTPGDGDGEFNFSPVPENPGESLGGIAFAPDGTFYVGDAANHRIQKFDADRTFLLSWGTEGEGEGEFLLPFWPAIAPDGNVYVSDLARRDVQVFTPDGDFLYQLAGPGNEDHQLTSGGASAVADDGTVHVLDSVRGIVKMFDATGAYSGSWGAFGGAEGEFRGPSSIAIDPSGNTYVTDSENGRVQVFTPDLEFAAQWSHVDGAGTPFMVPLCVALDSTGGVYVVDLGHGTVQKVEVTIPAGPEATPVG